MCREPTPAVLSRIILLHGNGRDEIAVTLIAGK